MTRLISPRVEAYAAEYILLEGSFDLFNSIVFSADLAKNQKRENFEYR